MRSPKERDVQKLHEIRDHGQMDIWPMCVRVRVCVRVCVCVCIHAFTHKDIFRGLMALERFGLHQGVRNLILFTKQTFQLCSAFQHFPLIQLISRVHHLHK